MNITSVKHVSYTVEGLTLDQMDAIIAALKLRSRNPYTTYETQDKCHKLAEAFLQHLTAEDNE